MAAMQGSNIFDNIPSELPEELSNELASGRRFRLERIVSRGHASPEGFWYDQEEDEWVLLIAGAARLDFDDGRSVSLAAGDHLLIPAHCRHRVAWTDPAQQTVWLALFFDK